MQIKLTESTVKPRALLNHISKAGGADPRVDLRDSLQANFGLRASVDKRHDGRVRGHYYCQYVSPITGKRIRYNLGALDKYDTVGDARKAAQKILHQVDDGNDPQLDGQLKKEKAVLNREATFAALAIQFRDEYLVANRRPEYVTVAYSTLMRHAPASWASTPVNQIDDTAVRHALKKISGKCASNRWLEMIKPFYGWAAENKHVTRDAMLAVRDIAKLHKEAKRQRFLTGPEVKAVYSAMGEDLVYGPLFQVLLLTGKRRSEVANMRWSDLHGDEWHIPQTKNDEPDIVALPPMVMAIIEEQDKTGEFVFGNGQSPLNGWVRSKRRLDTRAGLDEPWTLHDFRRTMRTELSKSQYGIPFHVREILLGHKLSGVVGVYDRYDYLEEKRDALVKYSSWVQGLASGNVARLRA